jgi:hypothetical protein
MKMKSTPLETSSPVDEEVDGSAVLPDVEVVSGPEVVEGDPDPAPELLPACPPVPSSSPPRPIVGPQPAPRTARLTPMKRFTKQP